MAKFDIDVKLTGENGNIFNLISIVKTEMKKNKIDKKYINEMVDKVFKSSSYDEALRILSSYVNVY